MPVELARAVVDTNVILSAALSPRGAPAKVVDWLLAQALLVFTDATFAELESRIWKPKFDRFLSIERRQEILHGMSVSALWVTVPAAISEQLFSRDPTDDKFVHAALAAGPAWLVSGDKDLLVLADSLAPLGVQVLAPAAALALHESSLGR
jgi:putative PIN family toxin of toxin-antitoxin system